MHMLHVCVCVCVCGCDCACVGVIVCACALAVLSLQQWPHVTSEGVGYGPGHADLASCNMYKDGECRPSC